MSKKSSREDKKQTGRAENIDIFGSDDYDRRFTAVEVIKPLPPHHVRAFLDQLAFQPRPVDKPFLPDDVIGVIVSFMGRGSFWSKIYPTPFYPQSALRNVAMVSKAV